MHPEHLIPRNIYMKIAIPIAGCAHQAGICRFGTNPKTSVLDTNCKAHELDNLYVVDTSFFVSIGGGEPVANRDCECDPRGRSPIAEVGVSG